MFQTPRVWKKVCAIPDLFLIQLLPITGYVAFKGAAVAHRRGADRNAAGEVQHRTARTNVRQRQATLVALKKEIQQLRDDHKVDLDYQSAMIDELQDAVLAQRRQIHELKFQIQRLRRLPSRNRIGIRRMIDGLNLSDDQSQEATEEEEEEKRRQQQH